MPQAPTAHPRPDQLAAFSLGRLDEAAAASVSEHLGQCSTCRGVVENTPPDTLLSLLRAATVSGAPAVRTAGPPEPQVNTSTFRSMPGSVGLGSGPMAELPEVFGRYRIVKKIGQGGMGAVYQARDTQLDRLVALKVPHFRADATKQVYDRFYREARAAAAFDHPNLCPVYDVGCIENVHYLTMPFIDGKSLSDFIQPDKPQGPRQVASVVRKLALALQEAHQRGVIHRDLKPSNVMINQRKEPVIMDFGLARLESTEQARLTAAGVILGTPAYMSPEQVLGEIDKIGPRCDIYSLGVMLYELLTGQLPFQGSTTAVLAQIVTAEPRPPSQVRPGIDPTLEAICLRAMAKNYEARYASMAELAAALTAYMKNAGGPAVNLTLPPAMAMPVAAPARTMTAPPDYIPGDNPFEAIQAEPLVAPRQEARPARPRVVPVGGRRLPPRRWLLAGAALAGVALLGAIIFYVATNNGRVRIELNDPRAEVEITVDGEVIALKGPDDTVRLRVGEHKLIVTGKNYQTETQTFTVRRGETDLVKVTLLQKPLAAESYQPRDFTNSIQMKLAYIPAGSFDMGADKGDTDEKPVHRVTISKPYYLGKYEVTQKEYEAVTGENPAKDQAPDKPAQSISFEESVAFCKKLSDKEGRKYRLPTEAEWEYACRAGTTTAWSFGDDGNQIDDYAWHEGTSKANPQPVGLKKPNRWGLYDMHGNVWEFCSDWSGEYSSEPATDPQGPAFGPFRVIRGGSHYFSAWESRSSNRPARAFPARGGNLGFRVLLEVPAGGLVVAPPAKFGPLEHTREAATVAFSHDGKLLASASRDGTVKVWDLATGQERATLVQGTDPVSPIWMAGETPGITFSPDGQWLASWSDPGARPPKVRFWNVATAQPATPLPAGNVAKGPVAFSPDNKVVATGGNDRQVHLFDLATGKEIGAMGGNDSTIWALAFSADGKMLAAGSVLAVLHVWDVADRKGLWTRNESFAGAAFKAIYGLAFTPDGQTLVAAIEAGMGTFDAATGQPRVPKGRQFLWGVFSLAMSPDGKQVAITGRSGESDHFKVVDVATGKVVQKVSDYKGTNNVAWSRDGRLIATAGNDNKVRVWDTTTWKEWVPPSAPTAVAPQGAKEITNSIGMRLRYIPDGEFLMGSAGDTQYPYPDENPQHRVRISKPFYMGVHEVTQEEYERVMGTNPSHFGPKGPGGPFVAALDWKRLPVEQVTWNDAMEFCRKLSEMEEEKKAGRTYRLPTEAEWEYAARAGTTTRYWTGETLSSSQANYNGDYPNPGQPRGPWLRRPHTVGSFDANPFGLYDTNGNVWEWCVDGKRTYTNADQVDPRGPETANRMNRGGGWISSAQELRSAHRRPDNLTPADRHRGTGLRVVMMLEAPRPTADEIASPIGIKLRYIPAGEFLMGSTDSDGFAGAHEKPQHRVQITRPFYMGIHEVTVAQFRAFVGATAHKTDSETNPGERGTWRDPKFTQGDDHPVVNVSWNDADKFCQWLSQKEGKKYRLPTEAEWEYACRANTTTRFWNGNDVANLEGTTNMGDLSLAEVHPPAKKYAVPWNDGFPRTAPVGKFRANAFGLYDTLGNAWEWCADRYGPYAADQQTNPAGPATGELRVVRGGGWGYMPAVIRCANRLDAKPDSGGDYFGFRVVMEVPTGAAGGVARLPARPPGSPAQFLGYTIYDEPERLPEIASCTNIVLDRGWLQNGDRLVKSAREKGLPVVVVFHRNDRPGIEAKLIPFIRQNRDVVAAVGWDTPYDTYSPEEVGTFGRRMKEEFPGLQYWVSFTEKPGGKEETRSVPKEVDVILVVNYYDQSPEAVARKVDDAMPGWLKKAEGRPVVLRWVARSLAVTQPNPLRLAPGTMKKCGELVRKYNLAGLVIDGYGKRNDGWSTGIDTDPAAILEIKEIAREWGMESSAPAVAPEAPFKPLFNGKDLAGWKADTGDPKAWKVENGDLVVTGNRTDQGWLLTDKDYDDFLLRLEFQLNQGANSGVAFRAQPGEKRQGIYQLEIQLLDEANTAGVLQLQRTGGLYRLALDQRADLKALGAWNQLEIEVRGQSLRIAINGKETVRTDLDRFADQAATHPGLKRTSGRIGLQNWGGTVRFRRIELKDLAAPPAVPAPAGGFALAREFKQHTFQVHCVGLSADGKRAITGSDDKTAFVWHTDTGERIAHLVGHTGEVAGVALSPDGKWALTGSRDNTVRLWDVDAGKEVHRFEGHTGLVHDVAFSPDGKWAASASEDRTALLYDVQKRAEVHRLGGHTDRVASVAFSPRSDTVLTGGWDNTVRLWSVQTGKEVKQFTGHTGWVQAVAFSPDGKRILTGSGGGMKGAAYVGQDDSSVRLWDADTGKQLQRIANPDWGGIACVAFLPDSRHILFSEWKPFRQDRFLFLWDTETEKAVAHYQDPVDWGPVIRVATDGKYALIARSFRADNAAQLLRLPPYAGAPK